MLSSATRYAMIGKISRKRGPEWFQTGFPPSLLRLAEERGNLMLRYLVPLQVSDTSVPHFVPELNATLWLVEWKYFIYSSVNNSHPVSLTVTRLCPCATTGFLSTRLYTGYSVKLIYIALI